jgi:hypothetical protein
VLIWNETNELKPDPMPAGIFATMELCVIHFVEEADVFANDDEGETKLLPKFLPKITTNMELVAVTL